jgi:hypothetical protein
MRIERRGAVGASDPEVLQPVVVADPVDLVENQSHLTAAPARALAAQLAAPLLE